MIVNWRSQLQHYFNVLFFVNVLSFVNKAGIQFRVVINMNLFRLPFWFQDWKASLHLGKHHLWEIWDIGGRSMEEDDESEHSFPPKPPRSPPLKYSPEEAARHSQVIFEQDLPNRALRGPKLPWEVGIMAWRRRPLWLAIIACGCSPWCWWYGRDKAQRDWRGWALIPAG